jgi:hypothetical protein
MDTVPAEFDIVSIEPSTGTAIFFDASPNNPESANHIVWDLEEGTTQAKLTVHIQTAQSPGGIKWGFYKPTSCGTYYINRGAVAFELDPETNCHVPFLFSNQLTIEAIDTGMQVNVGAGGRPEVLKANRGSSKANKQ